MTKTASTRSALLVLGALALLAAGCSTPVPLQDNKDVPVESRTGTAPGAGGAGGAGTAQSQVATVDLGRATPTAAQRIV
jgi:hypothetical protein